MNKIKLVVCNKEVFCKKGVLRNLKNSQENTCAIVSFLIKLPAKKETMAQVFSCEFCEISKKTPCVQNTSGRLLLIGIKIFKGQAADLRFSPFCVRTILAG